MNKVDLPQPGFLFDLQRFADGGDGAGDTGAPSDNADNNADNADNNADNADSSADDAGKDSKEQEAATQARIDAAVAAAQKKWEKSYQKKADAAKKEA